jgi:hypothetical protein
MVPITGAEGAPGGVFRTRLEDAEDVHEEALVTVNVYVPGGIPVTVVEVPDPLVVVPPGDLVTVHDPEEGSPFSTTLPVGTAQVGCVIVPKVGAVGVDGCVFITIFPDEGETHPSAFETVYVYVFAVSPDIVVDVPDPVEVVPPGYFVKVQVPVAGRPLRATLPVAKTHVGCVIVPTTGAVGVDG